MKTDSVAKPLNEANVARRESNCRAGVQGGRRRAERPVPVSLGESQNNGASAKVFELENQVKRLKYDYGIAQDIWADADRRSDVGRCAMEASTAMRAIAAKVAGIKNAVTFSLQNLMAGLDDRPVKDEDLAFARKHGAVAEYRTLNINPDELLWQGVSKEVLKKMLVGVACLRACHKCPPSYSDEEKAVASFWAYWEEKGRKMVESIWEFDAEFLNIVQTAVFGDYRFI